MLLVSIITSLVAGSFAVSVEPGSCPNVTVVDLDLSKMIGRWYKYASTENGYDRFQKCTIHDWFPPKNGMSAMIATSISTNTGNHLENENEAFVNKEDFSLHVTGIGPLFGQITGIFWAFEAVYNRYIIAWVCQNQGANHLKTVIIFTRERNPSVDVIEKTRQIAAKNGISVSDLRKVDHKNCY